MSDIRLPHDITAARQAMAAGHFIPEELPEATAAELLAFFGKSAP